MKKIKLVVLLIAFFSGLVGATIVEAGMQCGLAPLPQLGCRVMCICDDDGCRWVNVC